MAFLFALRFFLRKNFAHPLDKAFPLLYNIFVSLI